MAPPKPKFEKASFVLSDENVLMSEETVKNRTEVKEADKTPVNPQIHNIRQGAINSLFEEGQNAVNSSPETKLTYCCFQIILQ